jgi:hypothetical protein
MEKEGHMASKKQVDANRRNAEKSTGPRTPEGKAKVRLNSLKHGLCAQDSILPGEDVQAFNDLTQSFHQQYMPTGATELFCLHKMLLCYWRTRRIGRMEADIFRWNFPRDMNDNIDLSQPLDMHTPGPMGRAFQSDNQPRIGSDAFSRIVRYEAHLDRAFYKAEAHLKQLQLERRAAEKETPINSPDASDFTPHTEPAKPLGKPPVLLVAESIHLVEPVSKVPVPPDLGLLRKK